MKLLIVLITHERLAYTKRTLKSLWANTSDSADYYLIVADNASTDGTQDYILRLHGRLRIDSYILNKKNYYPGKACNLAWEMGLRHYDATHLMRLDNDMQLVHDWDLKAEEYFKAIPELGQLGLEHEAIEIPEAELRKRTINGFTINEWPGVVGGPMIMSRKLWDAGVRYNEEPWYKMQPNTPAMQEDSRLSQEIQRRGYLTGHAQEELGRTFATRETWGEYPEYYKRTMLERGYDALVEDL